MKKSLMILIAAALMTVASTELANAQTIGQNSKSGEVIGDVKEKAPEGSDNVVDKQNAMKIEFNKMEEVSMPNFKGGEKSVEAKMFFDGKNRIMKLRLVPGASIGVHTHESNCEILYMLEGTATFICNGEEVEVSAGDCHYCEKGQTHSLINRTSSDIVLFAAVVEQ